MCANYTDFKKVLEAEPICPMCEAEVPPMSVKISDDPATDFKNLVNLFKDPTAKEEENEDSEDEEDNLLKD